MVGFGQVHAPFVHVSVDRHTFPQAPQFFLSVCTSTHPLAGQEVILEPGQEQRPLVHDCVAGQLMPQAPQLLGSLSRSTHRQTAIVDAAVAIVVGPVATDFGAAGGQTSANLDAAHVGDDAVPQFGAVGHCAEAAQRFVQMARSLVTWTHKPLAQCRFAPHRSPKVPGPSSLGCPAEQAMSVSRVAVTTTNPRGSRGRSKKSVRSSESARATAASQ